MAPAATQEAMALRRSKGIEGNLSMRHLSILVVVASLFVGAHGAAYGAPLQSYTPQTSGGTLITFDGRTDGELIDNQFPGVTFSQFGGTTYPHIPVGTSRPQIANV